MTRLARADAAPEAGREVLPRPPRAPVMTVVVADADFLAREGMRRLLEASGQVTVQAAVGDAAALRAVVASTTPDAVVTDIPMPPTHTLEGVLAARHIKATTPRTGVLVLSAQVSAQPVSELFRDGTARLAYLVRDRVGDVDQLVGALRTVVAGGSVVDPLAVEALLPRPARDRGDLLRVLTVRERDVLAAMAQGHANDAIAAELFISRSAVEKHITVIFDKFGLVGGDHGTHRRVAAVLTYLKETGTGPVGTGAAPAPR